MSWSELIQTFKELGLPVGLLLMLLIALYRILKFVAAKLFDEKVGYVTLLVEDHRNFLKHTLEILDAMKVAVIENKDSLNQLTGKLSQFAQAFSTTDTNRALCLLADLMVAVSKNDQEEVESLRDTIHQILITAPNSRAS